MAQTTCSLNRECNVRKTNQSSASRGKFKYYFVTDQPRIHIARGLLVFIEPIEISSEPVGFRLYAYSLERVTRQ